MRLPRLRRERPTDHHEEWMATAAGFAARLTETGSRCHLNDGSVRFCHWQAEELSAGEVGVRCTIHPGGRYLDSDARRWGDNARGALPDRLVVLQPTTRTYISR